jgi:hypothetical protein
MSGAPFGADKRVVLQIRREIAMEKRRMIERGRLEDKWRTRYLIEIDETGTRHKYVFGLCGRQPNKGQI